MDTSLAHENVRLRALLQTQQDTIRQMAEYNRLLSQRVAAYASEINRLVAVGRKNWLFAGSDSGGEHAAVLYSLIGTCRLNNVEPEKWLRYVIEHIQDWPANRVRDLLPWKVDLSSQYESPRII